MHSRTSNKEQGSIMVGLLVLMLAIGGLASILLTRSARSSAAAGYSAEMARLLFVAEAGLNLNYVDLEADKFYAVKDTAGFTWNAKTEEYESGVMTLKATDDAKQRSFKLALQYRKSGLAVEFSDRSKPTEGIDEIVVRSEARSSRGVRAVTAWYGFSGYTVGGAIMSDMIPTDVASGSGREIGHRGHISFTGDDLRREYHVYGDIKANGSVMFFDKKDGVVEITPDNASKYFATYRGKPSTKLAGTEDEIPDFTKIGSDKQLFDFARFKAAAQAGAGKVYPNTAAFSTDMAAANALGKPLEGIIYVDIDPAGKNPDFNVPINITGTFVAAFKDGTDPFFKVQALDDFSVNGADLSGVIPSDESTFTTGYPGKYKDATKKPSAVDISPAYKNFTDDEDVPALMYNNAVLDIHGNTNICGVVYGASFLEIENKKKGWHYFNGAMYAGGGIWFDAGGLETSATMIRWDRNAVDGLTTAGVPEGSGSGSSSGEKLVRKGYAVSK